MSSVLRILFSRDSLGLSYKLIPMVTHYANIGRLLLFCLSSIPFIITAQSSTSQHKEIFFDGYEELIHLYDSLSYTPENWRAGVHTIPRLYMTKVPETWGTETADKLPVDLKKTLFVQAILPLVLTSNELIEAERTDLMKYHERGFEDLTSDEKQWLELLAIKYRVITEEDLRPIAPEDIPALLKRVDIVPISLAVSQTALESGWGTSRFAQQGNALFGQMSWGKDVIKPVGQDASHGKRGIKIYDTPFSSVRSYMHNLNAHYAYNDFRDQRAKIRSEGRELTGTELAPSLLMYSTKREEYIEHVLSMIRSSDLESLNMAFLDSGPEIYLVPR